VLEEVVVFHLLCMDDASLFSEKNRDGLIDASIII